MNGIKIGNAYFRFYKWPTKAKRGSKKLIHNIISPFACHSSFRYISVSLLRPPDVLCSLSQMLSVPSQIPLPSPSCWRCWPPMALLPLGWGYELWITTTWGAWKVMPRLPPVTLVPLFWGKTVWLWYSLYFRALCGIRLRLHFSWTHIFDCLLPLVCPLFHSLPDFHR